MSLKKYLAKLAAKGPAEEKFADSLAQRMRLEIAHRFEDLDPSMMGAGKPATEMRLKAMESSIRKADHPDVSSRQWDKAAEQVQNKIDHVRHDFGKWTSIGQPSARDLINDYNRKSDHYRHLRGKEQDINGRIGQLNTELFTDPYNRMPRLQEMRAEIGKKLDAAQGKQEDAGKLWNWLRKTGMGEGSRPIKLRDHKAGITKDSLEKWIKKNQAFVPYTLWLK